MSACCCCKQRRGSEVILGSESHIHIYEQGGIAQIGGIHPRALPNMPDGTIDLSLVEAAVRSSDVHFPVTQVLILVRFQHWCRGTGCVV